MSTMEPDEGVQPDDGAEVPPEERESEEQEDRPVWQTPPASDPDRPAWQ